MPSKVGLLPRDQTNNPLGLRQIPKAIRPHQLGLPSRSYGIVFLRLEPQGSSSDTPGSSDSSESWRNPNNLEDPTLNRNKP